jgi:hypothetical protein
VADLDDDAFEAFYADVVHAEKIGAKTLPSTITFGMLVSIAKEVARRRKAARPRQPRRSLTGPAFPGPWRHRKAKR